MWREAKRSNEKRPRNLKLVFSNSERRRRNLNSFLNFKIPIFKKRKRKGFLHLKFRFRKRKWKKSLLSRSDREIWNAVLQFLWRERKIIQQALHFRNKKEKWKLFSQVWKGETDFESFSSRFPEGVHSPIGCICLSAFSCPGSSIPTPRKDNRQEPVDNYQEPVDNRHEPPPL